MRDRSGMKDHVITATPNMMAPVYLRGNSARIRYSRRDAIIGVLLAAAFIFFIFWFLGSYFYYVPKPMGA